MSKKEKAAKVIKVKEKTPAITLKFKNDRESGQRVEVVLTPVIKIIAILIWAVIFIAKVSGTFRKINKFFKKSKKKKK